jgi:hypothetical protein
LFVSAIESPTTLTRRVQAPAVTAAPTLAALITELLGRGRPLNTVGLAVVKRVEHLENVEKECTQLKMELDVLKRKETVKGIVTPKSAGRSKMAELTEDQKHMKMEVMWVMKTKVFRAVKFPVVGWNKYSDKPGTVCSMILEDVSFPVGATVEEKKVIYNEFIKKMLPRMLSICKNRVTQPMRDQFSGKLVFSWCLNMTVVELCFMNFNIVISLLLKRIMAG